MRTVGKGYNFMLLNYGLTIVVNSTRFVVRVQDDCEQNVDLIDHQLVANESDSGVNHSEEWLL